MFLFILQDTGLTIEELTFFLSFIGLAIVWFFFNKYKARFSKKILWILGSIIIIIGIFLSIYSIPNGAALFGVVVIFFGVIVMPLRDIVAKIISKTKKSKPKILEENSDSYHNLSISKANEIIHKGKIYKTNQKYKKAIDSFVKALSLDPNNAEPWYELGEINLIRNRIREALTCYKRAIDNKPGYPQAIERYKEVREKLKDSGNEQNQK